MDFHSGFYLVLFLDQVIFNGDVNKMLKIKLFPFSGGNEKRSQSESFVTRGVTVHPAHLKKKKKKTLQYMAFNFFLYEKLQGTIV